MTTIWKETGFIEDDPWVVETEDRKAGEGERVLLPLAEVLENGRAGDEGGGVVLGPFDDPTRLKPYLDRIEIIALTFKAFSDGRAFSQATLLRERLGYKGELRAVGDVLIDPLVLMLRCGFDSFAVTNATAINRLKDGRLPAVNRHYQPSVRNAAAPGGYSWRRVAKI
ncbi:DUF934 domain-containing protein [Martelella radicis]|uniref:Uncharacterized protein (DUF934 family) n=1 Tax=Martelella radicis TaxID=1397476 RepID=A0A7W6P8N2_9HYPH|nr:DUF934 domain-containing protein [Martelella radicis]MBB4120506.1 uncharacterized protein (DUF934 family) [Martelella radicis]